MKIRTTLQIIALGRITIPEAIRKRMGLKDGDLVEVTFEKELPEELITA